MIIWCPFETSASTAGGVIETLYSFFFISLGTPIITDSPYHFEPEALLLGKILPESFMKINKKFK